MDEDASFLRAIFNRPDDDVLRLVYADWLDEHDDPRAEYVRLDVEWHRTAKRPKARRAALEKRIGQIAPKLDPHWMGRMGQARSQPSGARLDLVQVTNGKGLIEVRGSQDTVLLVEGKPVALNWDDLQGSVGQYLVFTGHTQGAEYARQLTAFVAGEPDRDRPLADQLGPLLSLFVSGDYCLVYTPSTAGKNITTLECLDRASAARELIGYYPAFERHLVCTQPNDSLDAERVAHFREQIRAGRRPVVLTAWAERTWAEFVIDGHHKLAAYTRERVPPAVLGIVREHAPEISLDEGLGWLPSGHPGISEYRRVKAYFREMDERARA